MKTSWNALSCAGVCFSLWARAVGGASVRPVPRTRKSSPATEAPSTIRTRRFTFMTIPPTGGPPAWTRLVGVEAVGDARAQNLIDVVARPRVDRRIGDDRLPPPHDVLVLDLRGSGRREAGPAHPIEVVAGIRPDHRLGERGHALRRIRPRPGGSQHADRAHLPDLVVEHLVGVAVDVGDVAERIQDLVDLPPIPRPKVPRGVVLVERRVREYHHGLVLRPALQRLVEPAPLWLAHAGPRAGDAAVQRGHVAHPLLGRHLLGAPVIGSLPDRVEADEAHALVIEGPRALAEHPLPLGAHVQVPVVLAGDEDLLDRELLE